MFQFQEVDNWKKQEKPAGTTWAAEFSLREGESTEFLGSWIKSSAVHDAKERRAKQVITFSFPPSRLMAKQKETLNSLKGIRTDS